MRHTSKRTLVAAVLLLLFFAPWSVVFGQSNGHFEWAKGFGTGDPNGGACHITGSVTDSLGNLYILGQFRNDSEWGTGWDAERLLPMTPYGPWPDNVNTLIAKISPDGEMVWKKVIHSNNGVGNYPNDIKKVGDTAFACLVQMFLPTEDHYTYYLDTLIRERSDYPVPSMYVENPMRTSFILFDFEGNVIEQHFLFLTYTDTAGNDIVNYYNYNIDHTPWYCSRPYQTPTFDIDCDGNIYISRVATDHLYDSINSQNGMIQGIKFWVDSSVAGQCSVDNSPNLWYPQIVKFSPHFDTLLACRYVVQKNKDTEYIYYRTHTQLDVYGNVYFVYEFGQAGTPNSDTIVIDSTANISFGHTDKAVEKSFVVQFQSDLTPKWIITLDDSVIDETKGPSRLLFYDIFFDYDSNLLFLSASSGRGGVSDTLNLYSILTYLGVPLPIKNDAFFVAFRLGDTIPQLHSFGRVPARISSFCAPSGDASAAMGNLICTKNRVFLQSKYQGGVNSLNFSVDYNNIYAQGLGLIVFDYRGNVIYGLDYQTNSFSSFPGPMSLIDSVLYLSGRLGSDALFGDIAYAISGGSQAGYIAKYIDTAFLTPYTGDTGNVNITLTPDLGVFTAYPNPFRQRVNIKIENTELKTVNGTVSATLTDITGRSEEVRLTVEGDGRYVLDLTARPQASYLLTLTTDDGRQHTVRLLKQSDITPGR